MKPKHYTQWFTIALPGQTGVYQRHYTTASGETVTRFSHWDGSTWGWAAHSIYDAEKAPHVASPAQKLPWRGLTELGHREYWNA